MLKNLKILVFLSSFNDGRGADGVSSNKHNNLLLLLIHYCFVILSWSTNGLRVFFAVLSSGCVKGSVRRPGVCEFECDGHYHSSVDPFHYD